MPKLSVNVSTEVNAVIASKAEAAGQPKSEWIQNCVLEALSRDRSLELEGVDRVVAEEVGRALQELRHRIDQLETRICYENDVVLHHIKVVHQEAIYASVAAMASATSTGFLDDREAAIEHEALRYKAQADFTREFDRLLPTLKELRANAVDAAETFPKEPGLYPANGEARKV